MMRALALLSLLAWAGAASAQARIETAQSGYYVYCANGKIEVDSRPPDQMRSARGSNLCMLSQFGFLSDAQSFAQKNFGGAGKPCSCR